MANLHFIGFAAAMSLAVAGADYYQQTQSADLKLGELTASAYVQTISARFGDVKQAKGAKAAEQDRQARRQAGARVFLPEAPEGWTRRAWDAGDNRGITKAERPLTDLDRERIAQEEELMEASTLLRGLTKASETSAALALNSQTWVYERGDEIVSVRARLSELPKGNTISSNAMTMVLGNMNAMTAVDGWGVIQGVAFGALRSFGDNGADHYRTLTAVIGFGSEVRLDVRTNTSDPATREILNRVDYDGLNALLPRPLAHVGRHAEEVPLGRQAALAGQMIELREDLIAKRTRAAEAWLMAASSHEDAMTLALREVGFGIEGSMGDADAELRRELEGIEAESARPAVQETRLETPQAEATSMIARLEPQVPVTDGADRASSGLVSKPLPEEKIRKLQTMGAARKALALIGLKASARQFEEKNGLAPGSCSFSMSAYRVECGQVATPATQEASAQPKPAAAPRRLKLSGGSSCLENALGHFCKN